MTADSVNAENRVLFISGHFLVHLKGSEFGSVKEDSNNP